jgi:hypothetical protein
MLGRRDGKELGRMPFNERNPAFVIDDRSGTVYEVKGKEIIARRFAGLSGPRLE